MVAEGRINGLYQWRRAGTSKTHTVRVELEKWGGHYIYMKGAGLTAAGLFEFLQDHPDAIIVLDDVARLLKDDKAVQILLGALGQDKHETGGRKVTYIAHKTHREFVFTGRLIFISNVPLPDKCITAFRTRVDYRSYEPTEAQMKALMRSVAEQGWKSEDGRDTLTPEECSTVAEFVIGDAEDAGAPLDMRLLVEKAFPYFVGHRAGRINSDWRDHVHDMIVEAMTANKFTEELSDKDKCQKIVLEVYGQYFDPGERQRAWGEQTKAIFGDAMSLATMYRWAKKLRLR
jgi:hypothetical protein